MEKSEIRFTVPNDIKKKIKIDAARKEVPLNKYIYDLIKDSIPEELEIHTAEELKDNTSEEIEFITADDNTSEGIEFITVDDNTLEGIEFITGRELMEKELSMIMDALAHSSKLSVEERNKLKKRKEELKKSLEK